MMTRCCVNLTTVFFIGKRLCGTNKKAVWSCLLVFDKPKKRERAHHTFPHSPHTHTHTHNDYNIDDGNKISSPVLFLFRAAAAALVVVFIFSVILHERLRCDEKRTSHRLARWSQHARRNEQFKTVDRGFELGPESVFISQLSEQRRGETFGGFRRTESDAVDGRWWTNRTRFRYSDVFWDVHTEKVRRSFREDWRPVRGV